MDLFKDDPVRPNLNPKFRLTENRVNFLLTQDFTKPCAIICVAFTKDIPKTEKQLEMYSINKLKIIKNAVVILLYSNQINYRDLSFFLEKYHYDQEYSHLQCSCRVTSIP